MKVTVIGVKTPHPVEVKIAGELYDIKQAVDVLYRNHKGGGLSWDLLTRLKAALDFNAGQEFIPTER